MIGLFLCITVIIGFLLGFFCTEPKYELKTTETQIVSGVLVGGVFVSIAIMLVIVILLIMKVSS